MSSANVTGGGSEIYPNYDDLNKYDSKENAKKLVDNLLDTTYGRRKKLREEDGLTNKQIFSIQREHLNQVIEKHTKSLKQQGKDIKYLQNTINTYQAKLDKLQSKITKLNTKISKNSEKPESAKALRELDKVHKQIERLTTQIEAHQEALIKSKNEWQKKNQNLTNMSEAVKDSLKNNKRIMKSITKLDTVQSKVNAQVATIHHEKETWGLLSSIERKVNYYEKRNVIESTTSFHILETKLSKEAVKGLENDRKTINEYVHRTDIPLESRNRALELRDRINNLIRNPEIKSSKERKEIIGTGTRLPKDEKPNDTEWHILI